MKNSLYNEPNCVFDPGLPLSALTHINQSLALPGYPKSTQTEKFNRVCPKAGQCATSMCAVHATY